MLLKFHDPLTLRTEKVVFQAWKKSPDTTSLKLLRDLTASRRHVADAQDGIRPDPKPRDRQTGITERLQDLWNMEKYVSLLENLLAYVLPVQLTTKVTWWKKTVWWTSPLSGGPRFYAGDDLRYEYGMILNLYATLLREHAMEETHIAPREAVCLLRRASGIYEHLSTEVLPDLIKVLTYVNDRPVEVSPSMALAWKHICLGEAQAMSARIAEKNELWPCLLADLHKGCSDLYEKALKLVEDNMSEWKDISSRFLSYLKVSKALHELRMRRALAENAAKTDEDGTGVAIAILRVAEAKLLEVVPVDEAWTEVYTRELEAFKAHFKTALNENENVHHQVEPSVADLPTTAGRILVEPLTYERAAPRREFKFL